MSETDQDRGDKRSKTREAPETPTGYRSTRRGSRAAKQAKKAQRQHKVVTTIDTFGRRAKNVAYLTLMSMAALVVIGALLFGAVTGWNWVARWSARRAVESEQSETERARRARENLLVIAERDGQAAGFLALRADAKNRQIFGVAVPEGAFIEVPGRGFERAGESYGEGPEVSLSAISNFFTVPFERYVVVPEQVYQDALRGQDLSQVMPAVTKTNLTDTEREALASTLGEVSKENVALVPLQVKPISVGSQTYFEPQRDELAELLESWWGVTLSEADDVTRVIVYNGSGTPGIAGEAAQQLIRGGLRVVDTKNADRFDYATTQIVVQNEDMTAGEAVRKALGVGAVVSQPSEQDVADVIVIVGKDFRPSGTGN